MFARNFFKFFPTPTFLDMPHAGLHISDDAIRIIQFSHTHHGLSIAKHGTRILPPGIIQAGYIKDEKALGTIITELASEYGFSFVRASIPEEKMYLFKTEVPAGDEKHVRQNIEFKLEENVPLAPADALFSFDMLSSAGASSKRTAMVSVVPRKVVEAYLAVLSQAKVTALSFEVEARSLARSLTPKNSQETQLIVHIMNNKTGLYVVSAGVVVFTSTVTLGDDPAALQKEIAKVYSYWIEHGDGQRNVNRIILCGSNAQRINLSAHLSPNPAIPVEIGNVWTNAFSHDAYIPPISREESLDYAVAAGLALQ
jgi:Tfp pilus assembly PilM family ATPase